MQSQTKAAAGQSQEDSKFFYRTFPFFIWLLRDVTQRIPPDYVNIKDYFLKMVYLIKIAVCVKLDIICSSCALLIALALIRKICNLYTCMLIAEWTHGKIGTSL